MGVISQSVVAEDNLFGFSEVHHEAVLFGNPLEKEDAFL